MLWLRAADGLGSDVAVCNVAWPLEKIWQPRQVCATTFASDDASICSVAPAPAVESGAVRAKSSWVTVVAYAAHSSAMTMMGLNTLCLRRVVT